MSSLFDFATTGCLYKYRTLDNLERFLTIILDKKLYGALYRELNDPMEGYFQYEPSIIDKSILTNIYEGKQKTYICSLSKRGDIGLMWTHYADECRGCCLEVKVTSKQWNKLEVAYQDKMPSVNYNTNASDIFGVKSKMWSYEQEVRYIREGNCDEANRPLLKVQIKKVYFGYKVEDDRFSHLKKIIKAIDKDIEVLKMRKEDLNYGYVR